MQSLSTWISLENWSTYRIFHKKICYDSKDYSNRFRDLLFAGRSTSSSTQWSTGSEKVKFSVKNHKNIWCLMRLLEKWLTYILRKFWMVLILFIFFFLILFNPLSTRNIKKLDFRDFSNSTNFKHQQLENHKWKIYQPGYH